MAKINSVINLSILHIKKEKKIRADSEDSVSYFNAAILCSWAETIFWDCRGGSDQQGKNLLQTIQTTEITFTLFPTFLLYKRGILFPSSYFYWSTWRLHITVIWFQFLLAMACYSLPYKFIGRCKKLYLYPQHTIYHGAEQYWDNANEAPESFAYIKSPAFLSLIS